MIPSKLLTVLGCSPSTLPVLFDIVYETLGLRNFSIVKNIPVDELPRMEIGGDFFRYSIHGPGEEIELKNENLFFGIVGPKAKMLVFAYFEKNFGIERNQFINVLHPRSYVATSSRLERGIMLEPAVVVSSQTRIGFGVSAKRGACIGHHNVIEDFVEINPGVILSGNVHVGQACILGAGCVIRDGVTIGEKTLIGMGSVVTGDIPAGVIAYGNPCKVVRDNDVWKE